MVLQLHSLDFGFGFLSVGAVFRSHLDRSHLLGLRLSVPLGVELIAGAGGIRSGLAKTWAGMQLEQGRVDEPSRVT